MVTWRNTLLCGSALVALGTSFSAFAQQKTSTGTEEIVVTAQRRAEQLENVPMAVVAVTPERLEKSGIVGMEGLKQITVGAQITFGGAFISPAIRGVTTLTNGNQVENNVGVYVDGFYEPSSIVLNTDLANISDVQILKGPQGTLYGRNATGGAILINTLGPTKTWMGKFEASYGRFDDKSFTGHVSGPINDVVRFSLSGYARQTPGYLKLASPTVIGATVGTASSGEIKKQNVRGKLEADLNDNLTAQLGYSWSFTQDNRVNNYTDYEQPSAALPANRPTQYGVVAYNYPSIQYSIRNQGNLKLNWKTDIGTLVSTTGYTEGIDKALFDFDSTYAPISASDSKYHERIFQQGLDYNINAINNLDLLVGGLYYRDKLFTSLNYPGPNGAVNGNQSVSGSSVVAVTQTIQNVKSWAIYIDGTYHLTDQWALTAGGRYSHDTKNFLLIARSPGGVTTLGPLYNSTTWKKFTPRVNVRYELAPRTNVYASWTRGFRNGNFNASGPPAGFPFIPNKPETIDGFELGFKTAQSAVRFETSGFYYIYKNIQTNIVVPPSVCPVGATCNAANFFSNGPGAKIYGIDTEVTWAATQDFNVHAGAEWLHARYDRFPNASGTGLNGTTNMNSPSAVVQDWSGKQLARAPNFSGNLGLDYTAHIGDDKGNLVFAANVNYSTGYANNNASTYDWTISGVNVAPVALQGKQRFRQGAMAIVNGTITWNAPSEQYYVRLYGNNLTNHFYRLNYNGSALGTYGTRAEPITYGVRVGAKF